jgi:uncharacterized protein YdaU (DUF1376 family)
MQEAVPSQYPFFPFYAADWMTDTVGMTVQARGIYITLLCYQWINGHLPNNGTKLAMIAGCNDDVFEDAFEEIAHKFDGFGTDSKMLHNPRLERERTKAENISESRRQAGIMSGRSRRKQSTDQGDGTLDLTNDEQNTNHSQSQSHSQPGKKEASPPLPDALNREAWDEWVANRRECKRKPYTPRSIKTQTRKLAELSHQEQRDLIDYSIANGYLGIVWDRIGGQHGRRERLGPAERIEQATGVKRL